MAYNPTPITDAQLRAAAVPVSLASTTVTGSVSVTGTFWQPTQPVSGTITANAGTGTMAVSGPLTDAQLRLSAVPVSLTSTTVTGSVAVTGPLTDTQLRLTAVPVSLASTTVTGSVAVTGTFWQATQPVSGTVALGAGAAAVGTVGVTSLPALVAGAAAIGTVAINAALPTGANTIGTTTGPTLTKGTQSASGYSVQPLKDAGRVLFSAATVIGGVTCVTTEALLSLVSTRAGVAAAGATTIAVTSGKTLRITGLIVSHRSTGAAVLSTRVALRMNPAGAAAATSPIIAIASTTQQAAALAEAGDSLMLTFADGLEFTGTQQIGLTQVASAITGSIYATLVGFEY